MENGECLMEFELRWRFVEYCLKFLISFGLSFLGVEGKVFPWWERQGFLLVIEEEILLIEEVMSTPCSSLS